MALPDLVSTAEGLEHDLAALMPRGIGVTRDQAQIGPRIAQDGICVYLGLLAQIEPATLESFWTTWPVYICVASPFGPRQADAAYEALGVIVEAFDVRGYRSAAVDIGELAFPSLTVDIRRVTTC